MGSVAAVWIGHEGRGGRRAAGLRPLSGRTARWKPLARIAGWEHGTAALPLQPKLDRSQGQPYVFPHVRRVEGARTVAVLNIGGSLTTAVSFIVTRED